MELFNKYKKKYLNAKFNQSGGTKNISEQINQIIKTTSNPTQALAKILSMIMQSLDIGQNEYMIMSSYCLHHIRPVTDLDVIVTTSAYLKLKSSGIFEESIAKISGDERIWINFPELGPESSIEFFPKEENIGFPSDEFSLNALQTNNKLVYDEYSNPYFNIETCVKLYSSINKKNNKFYSSDKYEITESRVRKNIDLLRLISDYNVHNPTIRALCEEKINMILQLLS